MRKLPSSGKPGREAEKVSTKTLSIADRPAAEATLSLLATPLLATPPERGALWELWFWAR